MTQNPSNQFHLAMCKIAMHMLATLGTKKLPAITCNNSEIYLISKLLNDGTEKTIGEYINRRK